MHHIFAWELILRKLHADSESDIKLYILSLLQSSANDQAERLPSTTSDLFSPGLPTRYQPSHAVNCLPGPITLGSNAHRHGDHHRTSFMHIQTLYYLTLTIGLQKTAVVGLAAEGLVLGCVLVQTSNYFRLFPTDPRAYKVLVSLGTLLCL